jgi:carbon monoxide dehydrogenase subunit G
VKLEGEYTFCGPREDVWELVRDPEVLATALPGAQSLQRVSDSEYEGMMKVRIGPVAGSFSGRVVVSDEVPPESYVLNVEGKGKPGWARGSGQVHLIPESGGKTLMKYEGDIQIGGKLANVGQRLIDSVSKSMIRQGLDVLDDALQARMTAECTGEEVEFKPPSEAKFAASVAKDMLSRPFRRDEKGATKDTG